MTLGTIHFPAFNTDLALGHGKAKFVGLTHSDIKTLDLSRGGRRLSGIDKSRARGMLVKYKDVAEICQPITNMVATDTKFEIESVREKSTIIEYFENIIKKHLD